MRPEILNQVIDKKRIEQLKQDRGIRIVDFLDDQIKELSKIKDKKEDGKWCREVRM